ncbi:MAG: hypothetical protein E7608_01830 [Ruminococcaceae bacterium]|nr:hypothetical protein [Oscillospiraceae bacterium]MBO5006463.1 hypothetical protein [Clostridia bacterium]
MNNYLKKTDIYGKIWIWTAALVVIMVPVAVCVAYNAWPPITAVLKGLLGVAPMFWTVGVIEVITYTPMLGTGGTYLAFVTGNLTSIKAPAALNAMENLGVKADSEEGEVVSTIAIATSSIVTTLIILLGVCLLAVISPILNSPALQPAFDNILPALFGGLGVVYISKNWKLSIAPLVFMIVLFLLVPSLAGSVGVLVPVGIIITLAAGRFMYKKGWL